MIKHSRARHYQMRTFSYTRLIISAVVSLAVVGCQSDIYNAGKNHKEVAAKWHELSHYADSILQRYGIMITAKLREKIENKEIKFQLSDIRLTQSESHFEINLLNPNFNNKYICTPECLQLVEYNRKKNKDSQTLLYEYFNLHEFELYKFYGDLVILDESLKLLKNEYPQELKNYIRWLSINSQKFNSLKDFSNHLADTFTKAKLNSFTSLKDTHSITKKMAQASSPNSAWDDKQFKSPADNWKPEEEMNQELSFLTKETIDKTEFGSEEKVVTLPERGYQFRIDQQVCTFSENYFGNVTQVDEQQITIKIAGQAKTERDGLFFDLPAGSLLKVNAKIAFMPKELTQTFSVEDVSACNLQLNME